MFNKELVNKERGEKIHKDTVETLMRRVPTFRSKYITLQSKHQKIEGKLVLQKRIRDFLKEFVQHTYCRKNLITFYQANKHLYSSINQTHIEKFKPEMDEFTDICLTNLLQAAVYQQIIKHRYECYT